MPVARPQWPWAAAASSTHGTGRSRASTNTKSFPEPAILKTSPCDGIIARHRVPRGAPSQSSGERPESQPPDHPHGLEHDRPVHFALPLRAIHKNDGDFDDPEPLLPSTEAHLDLKPVAV